MLSKAALALAILLDMMTSRVFLALSSPRAQLFLLRLLRHPKVTHPRRQPNPNRPALKGPSRATRLRYPTTTHMHTPRTNTTGHPTVLGMFPSPSSNTLPCSSLDLLDQDRRPTLQPSRPEATLASASAFSPRATHTTRVCTNRVHMTTTKHTLTIRSTNTNITTVLVWVKEVWASGLETMVSSYTVGVDKVVCKVSWG